MTSLCRRAATIALAALVLAASPVALPIHAHATDLDTSSSSGSRFVRIGLNKSVVIKLPANARDVLVGNPDIVDAVIRTKNTAYLFARAVGQTNVFFFDANGRQILGLDLEVAQDMAALQNLIRRTIPGSKITVDTINDNIVLAGTAANPAEAKTALDLATKFTGDEKKVMSTIAVTGKEQVMLRVRVAEVQRTVLKQFGINWQAMFDVGKFAFNLASINPFSAGTGLLSPTGGYAGSYQSGSTSVDAVLRAMERDGLLKTLAEPTLTAISGESAKFLAGGEFPVPIPGDVDNPPTVEYKPFGVGLGFTPIVMTEGRISLSISTEVSEIDSQNSVVICQGCSPVPALVVRRANTTVELPSGGSLMLAGLINDATRQNIDGTPGLKNIPVLGALFRSRDFIQNQTELVVIVTPYVVDPVNQKQLATPMDRLNIATDSQTILLGRLNKIYGAPGNYPNGVYHGQVGFIVE
ncbi:MAG: type II and III secretion system protein family protein [Hyphomicrobiales bacterium]